VLRALLCVAFWHRIKLLRFASQHDLMVSGLDWNANTNQIVSCSHDRSAFVWNYDAASDSWKATITVLRLPRACTAVKWNPAGTKLAVASSAKLVPVLAYEAEYNWWVGKQIKTHKSTVTDLAWHPSGKILATASTDYCCRLFSAHLEEVDGDDMDGGVFGDIGPFGTVLVEFNQAKSWVTAVSWSPSGDQLAFASHNCAVSFVTWDAEGGMELDPVPTPSLPNQAVTWLSDNCLIAAGHDMNPQVYSRSAADGHWHFVGYVDNKEKGAAKTKSAMGAARAMFADRVSKGQDSTDASSDKLLTKHTAAIVEVRHMAGQGASRFSTCSVDGRVVKWDVKAAGQLQVGVADLLL